MIGTKPDELCAAGGGARRGPAAERRAEDSLARLSASGLAVRAVLDAGRAASQGRRGGGRHRWRTSLRVAAASALAMSSAAATLPGRGATPVAADGSADLQLFQATNADRASNGVGPLAWNGTLQSVGENRPYSCGGGTVSGRAADMLVRNYFSHTILGCGQYVFSMMQAAGVAYTAAGENIGWSSGYASCSASVDYINQSFMNSSAHRANILDAGYSEMGVGSGWETGPWSGAGGSFSTVSMFAELFIRGAGGATPPPAPAAAAPGPASTAHSVPVATPAVPAVTAPVPAPAPQAAPAADAPAPAPTPTPLPLERLGPAAAARGPQPVLEPGAQAPLAPQLQGTLTDTVEQVLGQLLP